MHRETVGNNIRPIQDRSLRFKPRSAILAVVFASILLAGAVLVGCQPLTIPDLPDLEIGDQGVTSASGRIIYKSDEGSGSLRFNWKSKDPRWELRLRSRLGTWRLHARGNVRIGDVVTSDGLDYKSIDVEKWIAEETGISIPILDLPGCMKMDCVMIESAMDERLDSQGRLVQFSFDDWLVGVEYVDNQEDSESVSEFEFKRDDTVVRVLFDE